MSNVAAREPGVVVFLNPRSRANRRNPLLAAKFGAVLGQTGRVLSPRSLEELHDMAVALRDAPPEVVAVHGGDGTLHKVVTALGEAFGEQPLPPLALLPGGTMNVVSASLGLREKPLTFLHTLAEDARQGRAPELVARRCLRVGDGAETRLGFIFGNGLAANFLGEYYADDTYGPARAARLLFGTFLSAMWRGPLVRRVFKRFEGEVRVDGQVLPLRRFVGINAATVREVGMGFKLNHRADDDPERFGVLAIHGKPLALALDLWAVLVGRGVRPERAFSSVASTLEIAPMSSPGAEGPGMPYTIDGDLYRAPASQSVRITVGPRVQFVRPRRALAPAPAPQLPSASAGDTMEGAR